MTPEFARPVEADTIGDASRALEIGADETERRRLAGRFGLKAIEQLSADIKLQRRAGIVHAEGRVRAHVVQSCVVTDDPIAAAIDAPFAVRFTPDFGTGGSEEEVELTAEDCDTLPIEDGKIDLGELAAETLALALDPFPRSPRADEALKEAGIGGEEQVGAFAGLQALKDKLQGR